jgi:hypothetical protein
MVKNPKTYYSPKKPTIDSWASKYAQLLNTSPSGFELAIGTCVCRGDDSPHSKTPGQGFLQGIKGARQFILIQIKLGH